MGTASEIQLRLRCIQNIQNFQGKIGEKQTFLQVWGHSFCWKLDDENWLIIETPMDDFFGFVKKMYFFSSFLLTPPKRTGYSQAFHLFPSCVWIAKDKKPSISKQFKAFSGDPRFNTTLGWTLGPFFCAIEGWKVKTQMRYNIPNQVGDDVWFCCCWGLFGYPMIEKRVATCNMLL